MNQPHRVYLPAPFERVLGMTLKLLNELIVLSKIAHYRDELLYTSS